MIIQVCSKNSSFLLENSHFGLQTGPGAQPGVQPGVQVCSKKQAYFCLINSLFWVQTVLARNPARGPGLFTSFLLENSQQAFRKAQQAPSGRWPLISGREQPLLDPNRARSKQGQEHSQGSRSVLKTAHFCLRTATLEGSSRPNRTRSPARGPARGPGLF